MAEKQTIEGGGVTLTYHQLQELILLAVAEAKKPDPLVAAEQEAERAHKQKSKEDMVRVIALEQQVQKCTWGECDHKDKRPVQDGGQCLAIACDHLKFNGTPYGSGPGGGWGQTFSDGITRIFCGKCFKVIRQGTPSREDVAQGFGVPI